ncbi:hypothetical protein C483_05373 [Natrialba hulunbeirensis JCM 10989]|uniref:eCIS core domain-containing protein n=1 Tax=Natrialba hulunbeirensis JCM 10989 TaxID=1227493 RepID=M0A3M9_9EURY|nr:hypothetical protein C483_05373 [Natrialba hulunbeirensis JCM 10989]
MYKRQGLHSSKLAYGSHVLVPDRDNGGVFGQEYHIKRALDRTDTTQDEEPNQVLEVLGNGGQPLERSIQRTMENQMNADFSAVRIHTASKTAETADAIDAKVFTVETISYSFHSGEYDPSQEKGSSCSRTGVPSVHQRTDAVTDCYSTEQSIVTLSPLQQSKFGN